MYDLESLMKVLWWCIVALVGVAAFALAMLIIGGVVLMFEWWF